MTRMSVSGLGPRRLTVRVRMQGHVRAKDVREEDALPSFHVLSSTTVFAIDRALSKTTIYRTTYMGQRAPI